MRVIVYHEYGQRDVVQLPDIPKPTVGDGDLLIRVRVAGVNPVEWH